VSRRPPTPTPRTLLILAAVLLPAFLAPPAFADRAVFTPVADTFVSARAPKANHGRSRTLVIGGRPAARAYLRFDVALPAGAVVSGARLVLTAAGRGRSPRYRVHAVRSATWRERSITHRSAPRLGPRMATSRSATATLPAARVHAGRLTLAVTASSRRPLRYWSRQSARKPRLVLTYSRSGPGGAPGLSPRPTPSPTPGPAGPFAPVSPPAPAAPPPSGSAVVLAAGDVQNPGTTSNPTRPILDANPYDALLVLGDAQYDNGELADFDAFYSQTWGAAVHKSRTYPAPGNHEANSGLAANYCAYFRTGAAVDPCPGGRAYYSFDLGSWHVVSLDSSTGSIDAAQLQWLRADLAAHPARCTLAYWHHPRYSGGMHGSNALAGVWNDLMAAGVDLALAGHDHDYQRFGPMDDAGRVDPARGIRSFVVGTGGRALRPVGWTSGQEVGHTGTFGVLRLALHPGGYDWRFLPAAPGTFTDSGTDACR
jgi:acid phosphatase type 7